MIMLDNLGTLLQKYTKNISLEDRFTWEFPTDGLPDELIPTLPAGNAFKKNVFLKEHLSRYLPDETRNLEYWIVQKWGGIRGFKRGAENNDRIKTFYKQLANGAVSKDLLGRISSLSKIASFFDPKKYAIYDARATFSLNWLLLKSGATEGFFPVPTGRNTEINKYNIETIIRLKCGDRRDLFFNAEDAYFEYITLLHDLSGEIWDIPERKIVPYYLEMLLFVIAPQEVLNDIKTSVKIAFI